jgi:hypothetical protein
LDFDGLFFVVLLVGCVVVSNPVEAPPDHPKEKYAWEEDQNEGFSAHGFRLCA